MRQDNAVGTATRYGMDVRGSIPGSGNIVESWMDGWVDGWMDGDVDS
jgi:hypothetical protein